MVRLLYDLVPVHSELIVILRSACLCCGKTVTDLYSDHQFDTKNALVLLMLDRARFVEQVVRTLHAY